MTTTIAEVRGILPPSTSLTDPQIQAAIDGAGLMVIRFSNSYWGNSFSVEEIDQIHRYLSGHFASVTENTLSLSSESSDGCCKAAVKYGFEFGRGILGTPFGIMANSLSGGYLQEYDKAPAGMFSIGSAGGQAEDYFT